MTPSKYLIITADDYGYSEERDDGILECYHDNSISNVSVMVNGCHVEEAIRKADAVGLPMGLHLNLTEGIPVSKIPCHSIVGADGFMLGKLGIRIAVAAGKVDMAEIEREIVSQLEKFERLTGRIPTSVDGHQHVHIIPGICEIFASILQERSIVCTRLPLENRCREINNDDLSNSSDFLNELQCHAQLAKDVFIKHGLKFPSFTGLYSMGSAMSVDSLQLGIQQAFQNQSKIKTHKQSSESNSEPDCYNWNSSDHIVELMVHPGYRTGNCGGCGEGPDSFAQSGEREHEMNVLKDKRMRDFYAENNIKLTSFRDISIQGPSIVKSFR